MEDLFSVFVGGLAAAVAVLTGRFSNDAVARRRERLRIRREVIALADLARERFRALYFRAASCREPVPPSLLPLVADRNLSVVERLDVAVAHIESAKAFAEADEPEKARTRIDRGRAMACQARDALLERDMWLAATVETQRCAAIERQAQMKRVCGRIAAHLLEEARRGKPVGNAGSAIRDIAIGMSSLDGLVRSDPGAALGALERQARTMYDLTSDARRRIELWRQLRDFETDLPERAACVRAMAYAAARALEGISCTINAGDLARMRTALAAFERHIETACAQVAETKTVLGAPGPVEYQPTIRKIVKAETELAGAEELALRVIEMHEQLAREGRLPGVRQPVMVH